MPSTAPRMAAVLLFLVLPLTACAAQSQPAMLQELDAETSMLLFSDDENMEAEQPYYKALLNKSNQCSTEKVNIQIISSKEEEVIQYLDVNRFPSLYVMEGTETRDKYDGASNHTDIETFMNQYVTCGKNQ
ncbi:hypothetical protein [Salibacterium sp. K-3]